MAELKRPLRYRFVVALCVACCSLPAMAEDKPVDPIKIDAPFFQWHTTNVQLLRGHDYEVGSKRRTIMTLEHANGFKFAWV